VIDVHGTSIDVDGRGILLRGSPGAGKSDLALRLIDGGARLVADDRTLLRREADRVVMSPPPTIRGRIEVRGIGILNVPSVPESTLRLVVDLVAPDAVERLPERVFEAFFCLRIPLLALAPFEASAAAKLRLAVRAFGE
jgi:HPr kinase/phosphorylase